MKVVTVVVEQVLVGMSPVTTTIPGWLVMLTVDGTMKLASITADTRAAQAAIATNTTSVLRVKVMAFVEVFSKISTDIPLYPVTLKDDRFAKVKNEPIRCYMMLLVFPSPTENVEDVDAEYDRAHEQPGEKRGRVENQRGRALQR